MCWNNIQNAIDSYENRYYQVSTNCLYEESKKMKRKNKENNILKIRVDEVIRDCLERLDLISGAKTVKTLREVCLQMDQSMSMSSTFQQWISELRGMFLFRFSVEKMFLYLFLLSLSLSLSHSLSPIRLSSILSYNRFKTKS